MNSTYSQAHAPEEETEAAERVAVVGMAGRFPGAADLNAFWGLLTRGEEGISRFSAEELAAAGVPPEQSGRPGYVAAAPALANVAAFDAGFFGYTPREAELLDPQQRLFLECSWEALENAGWNGEAYRGSCGVYAGAGLSHYLMHHLREGFTFNERGFETLIGNDKDYLAARTAYKLDLGGPAVGIQTACSTSLVAIHTAAQALLGFEVDMALAGGVTVRLPARAGYQHQEGGLFSPDGHCRPFDARAAGTLFGSGVGVVVLKRYSDAVDDGDTIRAVILGSAVNNDGARKVGFTAPGEYGQVRALGEALEVAGIEPGDVGYIETHGTGTVLGDPIEAAALRRVYADVRARRTVALGAVKSNIGHVECAAGVAGFIKAVLMLEHGQLPPTLHFEKLNDHIDFSDSPFYVNDRLHDWARGDRPRVAGVSSFGIGGTNAHILLEEAPGRPTARRLPEAETAHLLTLSARSEGALHDLAVAYDRLLADGTPRADLCAAAALRRMHHSHRLTVVGRSRDQLSAGLRTFGRGENLPGTAWGTHDPGKPPKIVFVYPGQGSQWQGMARALLAREAAFREAVEACDKAVRRHAGFSVLDVLRGNLADRFEDVDVVQPTLFAVGIGLTRLWQAWGVQPAALIGHSQGEIAAAYVAGALSLDEAVRVVCLRSALVRRIEGRGGMAVAELTEEAAAEALRGYTGRVAVAALNSPRAVVLSGDLDALDEVVAGLDARGVYARKVQVTYASHCAQVDAVLTPLAAGLADLRPKSGEIPLYSTLLGEVVDGAGCGADYWCRNLRRPVRFAEMARRAAADGHTVFLEISPHPVLTHALRDCFSNDDATVVLGSLRRDEDGRGALLESLGVLYTQGVTPAFAQLYDAPADPVALPAYPWQHQDYWIDPPESGDDAGLHAVAGRTRRHALLRGFLNASRQPGTRTWQLAVSTRDQPFLAEHTVGDQVIVPAAFYLELAQAAVWQAHDREGVTLSDVRIAQALFLPGETRLWLQVVLEDGPGGGSFTLSSCDPEQQQWTEHASGRYTLGGEAPAALDADRMRARCTDHLDVPAFYADLRGRGFGYGPAFRGLVDLHRGDGEALARLEVPASLDDAHAYRLHPAVLDACFQTLLAAAPSHGEQAVFLPVGLDRMTLLGLPRGELQVHGRLHAPEADGHASGDVILYDEDGKPLVEVRGMRFRRVVEDHGAKAEAACYQTTWLPAPDEAPAPAPEPDAGPWLLFAAADGASDALAEALQRRGIRVVMVHPGSDAAGHLDPTRGEQAADLLASERWAHVVYGWAVGAEEADDAALCRTLDVPLALARRLIAAGADAPGFTLLTRGGRDVAGEAGAALPLQAAAAALVATLASEQADLDVRSIDLDPRGGTPTDTAWWQGLALAAMGERVALRGDTWLVARLVPRKDARPPVVARPHDGPWRLHHGDGALTDLHLRAAPIQTPGPGEVLVTVKAAGLNFRDVLVALGRQPDGTEKDAPIGAECAGVVAAVGEGVTRVAPGDAVVALALPAFAAQVIVPEVFVCAKPEALSFAEAACMLITPMTVYQALVHLARVQPGERVLIHSGAGGTGLAAIAVAQMLGAEIYATAGNEDKRAYLRGLGLAWVGDSRSTAFVGEILQATDGRGVDVVLNSLRGEAMMAGLDVLAPFGRFVELGIADIFANTRVGLWPFHKNLSYFSLEMARLIEDRPEDVGRLLGTIMDLLKAGTLKPLPVTPFPVGRAADAFGYMARAVHIGKVALTAEERPAVVPRPAGLTLHRDGAYLITGGLGGLGLTFADWLAGQGAGRLILMGRRAPDAAVSARLAALRRGGVEVVVSQGDVARADDVARALAEASADRPLRGILHAAGAVDDDPLTAQTAARLRTVSAPKIAGSLHLHRLSRDLPLDFFLMFSSTASVFGTPGQAGYAAGNAFMDGLAAWRHALGLPALSINWGGWGGVGMAAEQLTGAARRFALQPEVGLAAAAALLPDADAVQVAVTPVPLPPHLLGRERRPPLYALLELEAPRAGGDPGLRARLDDTPRAERQGLLETYLVDQVAAVLRIPASDVAADAPLNQYGLTSLFALELRNRVEGDLGLPIPVLQFFQSRDLRTFAAWVLERLALTAVLAAAADDAAHEETTDDAYDEITL